MPKSKRNKLVSLTNVKKKGKEAKEDLVEKVQEALTKYKHCFSLEFENMRTNSFRKLQKEACKDSKY